MSARIVNMSPIEMTTEGNCGGVRFIVATKREATTNKSQILPYCPPLFRLMKLKGKARTYTQSKYSLHLRGRSLKRIATTARPNSAKSFYAECHTRRKKNLPPGMAHRNADCCI